MSVSASDNGNGGGIIKLRDVGKSYQRGKQEVSVLRGIDLDIPEGSFEALMGPSGSGKTTLINLIGGLDRPSEGSVEVGGVDIAAMSEGSLAAWRARHIGFVFQFYNLLPVLTAFQNVELPLLLSGLSKAERRKRVETALRVVGIEERQDHYPRQLSAGQEQRVAIARALVPDPTIILADEPTGDLDRESADEILQLLSVLHGEFGKTIFMITHDPQAARTAKTVRRLDKGKLATLEA